MLRSLAFLAALALAGCASGEADAPIAPEAETGLNSPAAPAATPEAPTADHGSALVAGATAYTCTGGAFSISPLDGGAVEVTLNGATQTLQPEVGKQGVYKSGPLEVWVAAEGAFVMEDGEILLTDCQADADA